MNFGERDAMLSMAKERLEQLKASYPKAQILDADQVRVIFLVVDDPRKYHKNAMAGLGPARDRKLARRQLLKPVGDVVRILAST